MFCILEAKPCCTLNAPIVEKHSFLKHFSIRWTNPSHLNGQIKNFSLQRAKIIGNGCLNELEYSSDPHNLQNIVNITLTDLNGNFFYDPASLAYIFKDSSKDLLESFGYYIYKVKVFNSVGSIESTWSTPLLSWQLRASSPPLDLKINRAHATGFSLLFNEPKDFNGLLKHYIVKIEPFNYAKENFEYIQEIIIPANNQCKTRNASQLNNIELSGLQPFKSYTLTMTAVNKGGLISNVSEKIVANTIESSPEGLRPMVIKTFAFQRHSQASAMNNLIRFRFDDPASLNGALKKFNLYQYSKDLVQVYSGPKREFNLSHLEPYKNYLFSYEICTYAGCSRQKKLTKVQTLENAPLFQQPPTVIKYQSIRNCFKIIWMNPLEKNGVLLYFELVRLENRFKTVAEKIVHNVSNLTINLEKYSYIDCNLKTNAVYSYKVVSYNSMGSATSNFSFPIKSDLLLPEGFNAVNLSQLSDTIVEIRWSKPTKINGFFIYYVLLRDSMKIGNITQIQDSLNYSDKFDFLPKYTYHYEIQACNEAGCSTNEKLKSSILIKDQAPYDIKPPKLISITKNNMSLDATDRVYLKSDLQEVIEYRFFLNKILVYQGRNSSIIITDLVPDTFYTIHLIGCTFLQPDNGCSKQSPRYLVKTNQSNPENLSQISILEMPLDDYFLNLRLDWNLPRKPNGLISLIELTRDRTIIFLSKNISARHFVDAKLNFGSNYTYKMSFYNEAGPGSIVTHYYTSESLPKVVEKPRCVFQAETHLFLEWNEPVFPNGKILRTLIKFKSDKENDWNILVIFFLN